MPSLGDLTDLGIKLEFPCIAGDSLPVELPGKPKILTSTLLFGEKQIGVIRN